MTTNNKDELISDNIQNNNSNLIKYTDNDIRINKKLSYPAFEEGKCCVIVF